MGGNSFHLFTDSPDLFADLEGLEYERHGLNLRSHRGDQEVRHHCGQARWPWIYPTGGDGATFATADGGRRELSAGEPLPVELPSLSSEVASGTLPDLALQPGWELDDRWFEAQLLSAYALPPPKEAFQIVAGRRNSADPSAPAQRWQIDDTGWALGEGFRLGAESHFTTGARSIPGISGG